MSNDFCVQQTKKQKGGRKKRWMLFSIRNKIVVCFLVPIIFMIVIGATAYQRAADGMSKKYSESTQQTINMAVEYVDMSCNFIEAETIKYAFDSELAKYFVGLYDSNKVELMNLMNNVKSNLMASQTANDFISDIHIITKQGIHLLSTSGNGDGFFSEYKEQYSDGTRRGIEKWIDDHALLDEKLGMKRRKYIMAYQTLSQSGNACVVIDVKRSALEKLISELDLGEGSIVGFVTKNGNEIICENLGNDEKAILPEEESVFYTQSFFPTPDMEDKEVVMEVKFRGGNYMFFYDRSEVSGGAVCALVPMQIITGQAETIKTITAGLVVLACIVVLVIGFLIVISIQRNMKGMAKTLEDVAEGNLTVRAGAKSRDEFRNLADSANDMIVNTKKLVDKVGMATMQLEESAQKVEQVSGDIGCHSADITQAINGISESMTQQTANVQECVAKTDCLSEEMQGVSTVVEQVQKLVTETEEMIGQGMGIVRNLGEKAEQTTEITMRVAESIESLRRESENINSFIGTITDISEQTNLLSLNASIEAARAGEAGRGFSVVAEEIRKLADDSAAAAGEIKKNVEHITAQTLNSVDSARGAQTIVASQTEAVEQVVGVFREIKGRMDKLVDGLNAITTSTEKADAERVDTVRAIRQISGSIEETAGSAMTVRDAVEKLMEQVAELNQTADSLGENMDELKSEISVFKR